MSLLKAPSLAGAKPTTRFVELKPGRLNGAPERMLNGPPEIEAVPLVMGAPPRLVRTKLAWAPRATSTMPKSRLAGRTANCGGVRPTPVTELVLLPPLLTKTTALLKLPALVGLN